MNSYRQRQKDIKSGNRTIYENKDYYHNKVLRELIERERRIAWAEIVLDPKIQALQQKELERKAIRDNKLIASISSDNTESVLNMYK